MSTKLKHRNEKTKKEVDRKKRYNRLQQRVISSVNCQPVNQHKKSSQKKITMKKIKEETDSIHFQEDFNGQPVRFVYEKRTGKIFIPSLSADLLYTAKGREFVGKAKGKIKRIINNRLSTF